MDLNADFRDMLSELNDAEVDYLVVGAYALAAHGHPRATGDLDVWVRADLTNATKLCRALKSFGAPTHGISEADFTTPSIVFQIGLPPSRIDILTMISGITFDMAWPNRMYLTLDGIPCPVISRTDLIANKRASGRPKDIADLHSLGIA